MNFGRNLKTLISILLMILLISALACSGHDKPTKTLTPAPVPSDKVAVSVSSFNPPNALVIMGTEVTWTNLDGVSYLVAENGQRFAFNLPAEGSFSLVFSEPGTYGYHCSGHPGMQGTITVVKGTSVKMGISGERSLDSSTLRYSRGNG